MAADDLTAIPGLLDKHRRVLNTRLQITTFELLAGANPEDILRMMARVRPRPTLKEIRGWQDQARRRQGGGTDASGWQRAATFVLSFERRLVDGKLERRLVAEQTELEPEQPPNIWPGWDCSEICGWLQQRVGGAELTYQVEAPSAAETAQSLSAAPAVGAVPLSFENVAVVDTTGQHDAFSEGRVVAQELECVPPCWLEIQVKGASPGREVQVVLRVRGSGRARWSSRAPATVPALGPVKLDLSDVAPGQYHARLVAWASDASAEPIGIEFEALTIRAPVT